jgi:hypothetical protein
MWSIQLSGLQQRPSRAVHRSEFQRIFLNVFAVLWLQVLWDVWSVDGDDILVTASLAFPSSGVAEVPIT